MTKYFFGIVVNGTLCTFVVLFGQSEKEESEEATAGFIQVR